MNDDWAKDVSRRLRAAAAAPPTADALVPDLQDAARRAAALSTARGRPVRMSVTATATTARLDASGPGAAAALASARADVARRRPQMAAKLRSDAYRRLR